MKRIILSLAIALWAFEAYGSVYFITGGDNISFADSKQSYGCNDGWNLVGSKCVKNTCSPTTYPLTAQPDVAAGTVVSCKSGDEKFYGFSSCNNGWETKNGSCEPASCTGYPYNSKPDTAAGTIISCKSGINDFYGYSSCKTGWSLSAGECNPAACAGYPFSASPDTTIGTVSSTTCKSGTTTKYKYASCKTGWDLNNGACDVHICDSSIYLTTSCINNATCATCYTGGNIRYASPVCNSGYELSGGTCVSSCNYTMTSLTNCDSQGGYDSCVKSGKTYYKCNSCYGGTCYKKTTTGCDFAYSNESSFYDLATEDGCKSTKGTGTFCYYSYNSGSNTRYKCQYTSCKTGYTLYNGMCFCSGDHKYHSDAYRWYDGAGKMNTASFASAYSQCVDGSYHASVTTWKPISAWTTVGTKQISISKTYDYMYPMDMFVDYCKANGGHLVTKDELTAMQSYLEALYSSDYKYFPYNEIIGTEDPTKSHSSTLYNAYLYRTQSKYATLSYYRGWSEYNSGIYYGYSAVVTICVKDECNYTTTAAPENCATVDSCQKGTDTYYSCKSCNNGWYLDSTNTCIANKCTGYVNTDCSGCGTAKTTCKSGNITYCKCEGDMSFGSD